MRIFMLGWEFPPFLAGGLGTACHGLTKGLVNHGHEVLFVLPQSVPDGLETHVTLLGPHTLRARAEEVRRRAATGAPAPRAVGVLAGSGASVAEAPPRPMDPDQAEPPVTAHPYPGVDLDDTLNRVVDRLHRASGAVGRPDRLAALKSSSAAELAAAMDEVLGSLEHMGASEGGYGGDLFGDAQRYAGLAAALGVHERFDVIHAHDWLAYAAGVTLRALTGKPLVCHIHATEYDRSGEHVNRQVADIERAGLNAADRVIAVSRLTKSIVHRRYGVPEDRIDVVYNGVDQDNVQPKQGMAIERDEKIVLFLGRITMQKGPEYFIRAAKRVLEVDDKVKFVVAGSGDMAVKMIEEAASLGIGHKVLFTGFLRGRDVDRVFRMADCYVMPSVSEPFGIAPLEAMRNDVPVIVSKQSGVSEILTHCLKVDFWDTDEMANKIVAVLRYPPLGQTLREHGRFELRAINWDGAAEKCVKSYARAIAGRA
ncbi:MAG: glycosyltransferase [Phycisphaerales bacterium]|nr:glycosyltransferase [Planctomycetota bacterium]MCH8507535.1 glycosyltransferase [Phycisphaerales bacterium]